MLLFRCCPFQGSDVVVVYSLSFCVGSLVIGGVLVVHHFTDEEERFGSVSLLHGAVGWYAICNYGIF